MASERLKHLKLAVIRSERDMLIKELMLLGCVQISETREFPSAFRKESAGLAEAEIQYNNLLKAVEITDAYAPPILGMFTRKQKATKPELLDTSMLDKELERADAIIASEERIRSIESEERVINDRLDKLKPWALLDFPLELSETEHCLFIKGFLPASSDFVSLATEIRVRVPESQMIKASSDRSGAYAVLIAMKYNCAKVLETADRYGYEPVYIENIKGSAADNIAELKKKMAELEEERKQLLMDIKGDAVSRNELKLSADRQYIKTELTGSFEKMLYTYLTANFEGWFLADEENNLLSILKKFACAWETSEPSTSDRVPKLSGKAAKESGSIFLPLACRPNFVSIVDERET